MATLEEDTVIYVSSSNVPTTQDKSKIEIVLSTPLTLSEATNFEAAVLKIQYPANYNNVTEGHIDYYSHTLQKRVYTRIADGYYPDAESFMKAFQKVLGNDSKHYQLTYVSNSKFFLIQLQGGNKSSIHLSENLTRLCGLPKKINGEGFHKADSAWDGTGGNSTLNVLCNIISLIYINDTKKPLILSMSYGAGQKAEGQIQYEPQNPIYIPLNDRQIKQITMNLQNEHGQPFPFVSSATTITLHVRPASPRI